jgi:hypothetical protein
MDEQSGPLTAAADSLITVTTKPEMHRIMRHEFSTLGSDFNPDPLHAYLRTLTTQQTQLLMSYPLEKYPGQQRLVVFITLLDQTATKKLMCADLCDTPSTSVLSNARFAVFWCNGTKNTVELVCYTEEFYLPKPPTSPTPNRRDAAKPTVYKISAMRMSEAAAGEGFTIWNRVSTVDKGGGDVGTAIYGGQSVKDPETGVITAKAPNSLHGFINTKGCWMLFRNHNWYKEKQAQFMEVYQEYRRNNSKWTGKMANEVTDLGYGDADGRRYGEKDIDKPGMEELRRRFLGWEKNFAYPWFIRDVIGIKYFSKYEWVNEDNIYDSVQLERYPAPKTQDEVDSMLDNFHSLDGRRKYDQRKKQAPFKMDGGLWDDNALGFSTAKDFAAFAGNKTYHLERSSWADLYVYDA